MLLSERAIHIALIHPQCRSILLLQCMANIMCAFSRTSSPPNEANKPNICESIIQNPLDCSEGNCAVSATLQQSIGANLEGLCGHRWPIEYRIWEFARHYTDENITAGRHAEYITSAN